MKEQTRTITLPKSIVINLKYFCAKHDFYQKDWAAMVLETELRKELGNEYIEVKE